MKRRRRAKRAQTRSGTSKSHSGRLVFLQGLRASNDSVFLSARPGDREVTLGTSEIHPLMRQVGRRIAELRMARGTTQEGFAIDMRCSVSYVQLVEAGRQNLTLTSLAKFARILTVDPAELLAKPESLRSAPGRPRKRDREDPKPDPKPQLLVADRRAPKKKK